MNRLLAMNQKTTYNLTGRPLMQTEAGSAFSVSVKYALKYQAISGYSFIQTCFYWFCNLICNPANYFYKFGNCHSRPGNFIFTPGNCLSKLGNSFSYSGNCFSNPGNCFSKSAEINSDSAERINNSANDFSDSANDFSKSAEINDNSAEINGNSAENFSKSAERISNSAENFSTYAGDFNNLQRNSSNTSGIFYLQVTERRYPVKSSDNRASERWIYIANFISRLPQAYLPDRRKILYGKTGVSACDRQPP